MTEGEKFSAGTDSLVCSVFYNNIDFSKNAWYTKNAKLTEYENNKGVVFSFYGIIIFFFPNNNIVEFDKNANSIYIVMGLHLFI